MDAEAARRRLEDERSRLAGTRDDLDGGHLADESADESVAELSHLDQHPADSGSETFEREKDLSILRQVETELDDVERALRRLDEGTYGRCEACAQPIADERLEAVPAARFCVEHQHRAERTTPGG